ncbi:hypothetical protein AX15_006504 [Amanita polypyramis BW_CC]|nr:hypothetical protein AX15_006504 [Amanita polypyramis BW_CC]
MTCRDGYRLARNTLATISYYPAHAQAALRFGRHLRRHPKATVDTNRPLATSAVSAGQIPTLLYKTKAFASQVLRSKNDGVPFTESSEFWEDVLTSAYDDYQLRGKRPARLVVYGVDRWSCSEDLVTALLSEPLASDGAAIEAVRNRHHKRPKEKPLTISYGQNVTINDNLLQVPSTYLQQFATTIQMTESHSPTEHSPQSLGEDDCLVLFKADFPIIVLNPVTTPLRDLLAYRLPNHTILALTAASVTEPPGNSHPVLASASSRSQAVIYVDPPRAMNALTNLKSNPSLPSAIQRYQDDFIGSRVSSVTQIVRNALAVTPGADFRNNIVLAHLRCALLACQDALHSARTDLENVLADIASMTTQVQKARNHVLSDVLGYPYASQNRLENVWPSIIRSKPAEEKMTGAAVITETLGQAQKQMSSLMDNFTWWRMVWRVDEISSLVGVSVDQTWCPELERKLIMQTGRLVASQKDFTIQTFTMLEMYKGKPPFNSALLQNTLQQKCTSPVYTLSPSTLTEPLHRRKIQLNDYPTTYLHLRGQRAAIGMGAGIVTSTSFGWAGWLGWLSGSGLSTGTENTVLNALSSTLNIGIEPGMAVGISVLGVLASVRWAVGRWERAKKEWWGDWVRVCQGLERDLKATLEKAMKDRVTIIAEKGCEGLQQLAEQRREEIAKFDKDLEMLQAELNDLERQMHEAQ